MVLSVEELVPVVSTLLSRPALASGSTRLGDAEKLPSFLSMALCLASIRSHWLHAPWIFVALLRVGVNRGAH